MILLPLEFTNIWETAYDVTTSFDCSVNRSNGDTSTSMFLINHFLDTLILGQPTPNINAANQTNAISGTNSLGEQFDLCVSQQGRNPNFMLVDVRTFHFLVDFLLMFPSSTSMVVDLSLKLLLQLMVLHMPLLHLSRHHYRKAVLLRRAQAPHRLRFYRISAGGALLEWLLPAQHSAPCASSDVIRSYLLLASVYLDGPLNNLLQQTLTILAHTQWISRCIILSLSFYLPFVHSRFVSLLIWFASLLGSLPVVRHVLFTVILSSYFFNATQLPSPPFTCQKSLHL